MDGEIYLHLGVRSTGGGGQKTQVNKLTRAVISLASKRCYRHCIFSVHHLHKMLNFTGVDGFTTDDNSTTANMFTFDEAIIPW